MTSSAKKVRELEVFLGFARAARRLIPRKSVLQANPPSPDIICKPWFGRKFGLELVEVLDQGMAQRFGHSIGAQQALLDAYAALSDEERRPLQHRGVVVAFTEASSWHERQAVLPKIFPAIASAPAGFDGRLDLPPALQGTLQYIHVTPSDLVHPVLRVSGFGVYGDPIRKRIEGKFGKTYEFDGRLELLAYYDTQDSLPFEIERDRLIEYLMSAVSASRFRLVWVYCHRERRVLMVYPSMGWRWFRVLRRKL